MGFPFRLPQILNILRKSDGFCEECQRGHHFLTLSDLWTAAEGTDGTAPGGFVGGFDSEVGGLDGFDPRRPHLHHTFGKGSQP